MAQICSGAWAGSRRSRRLTVDINYLGRKLRVVDAGGAAPLYVSRVLAPECAGALAKWAKQEGLVDVVDPAKMHVTVAYSRSPVDWFRFASWMGSRPVDVPAGGPRRIEAFKDGVVVLRFSSPDLADRWTEFRAGGCSWDRPGYAPHVTISAGVGTAEIAKLKAFTGALRFGPEEFSPIK